MGKKRSEGLNNPEIESVMENNELENQVVLDEEDYKPVELAELKKAPSMRSFDDLTQSSVHSFTSKKLVNPLSNKTVIIKFLPKPSGSITDKKHVLYGGLSEQSFVRLTVPETETGHYKAVLSSSEREFLEHYLGLPAGTMSFDKMIDNFWENRYIELKKQDNVLKLDNPNDFIKYKIAIANDNIVAENKEILQKKYKATYRFIVTSEDVEMENAVDRVDDKSKAYMLFGENKKDHKKLIYVIKKITGKAFAHNANEGVIYYNVDKLITERVKEFIREMENEYLDTELLIDDAVKVGVVRLRNNYYYLAKTNAPLCEPGFEPTLLKACEFLNTPKNQETKFIIEATVNK